MPLSDPVMKRFNFEKNRPGVRVGVGEFRKVFSK